ncbi:hypothetical protein HNV12_07285 [Methanococcoides sp. SA1]|nr:hypothetical protein [Methanococcoides sp. SA1]
MWKLIHFEDPLSYASDSYFDGSHKTVYRGDFPTWDYQKITTPGLELSDPSAAITGHSGYRLLGSLAFDHNGSATVRDLIDNLEIPERSMWGVYLSLCGFWSLRNSKREVYPGQF